MPQNEKTYWRIREKGSSSFQEEGAHWKQERWEGTKQGKLKFTTLEVDKIGRLPSEGDNNDPWGREISEKHDMC